MVNARTREIIVIAIENNRIMWKAGL